AGHGGGDALAGRGDVAVLGAPGVHERGGLDDEAGRAVAALQPVVGHERPLHGVVQPFCGDDRPALHRRGGEQAARLGCAVDGDRAGPADAGAADRLGAGEAEAVAQDVHHHVAGAGVDLLGFAVHDDLHDTPAADSVNFADLLTVSAHLLTLSTQEVVREWEPWWTTPGTG